MYLIGKYTDRRNRQPVDCSKTIWIMATNALDDTILDFCDLHQGQVHQTEDSHRHAELMNELSGKLKKQLKSTFGVRPPLLFLPPIISNLRLTQTESPLRPRLPRRPLPPLLSRRTSSSSPQIRPRPARKSPAINPSLRAATRWAYYPRCASRWGDM